MFSVFKYQLTQLCIHKIYGYISLSKKYKERMITKFYQGIYKVCVSIFHAEVVAS